MGTGTEVIRSLFLDHIPHAGDNGTKLSALNQVTAQRVGKTRVILWVFEKQGCGGFRLMTKKVQRIAKERFHHPNPRGQQRMWPNLFRRSWNRRKPGERLLLNRQECQSSTRTRRASPRTAAITLQTGVSCLDPESPYNSTIQQRTSRC